MATVIKTEIVEKVAPQEKVSIGKCRGVKYHKHDHNKSQIIRFCPKCNATVPITDENTCYCCRTKLEREENFIVIRRILNKACVAYLPQIKDWMANPTPNDCKVIAEIKHGGFVYQIPFKFIALFVESSTMKEEDRTSILKHIRTKIDTVSFTRVWGSKHTSKMSAELLF